MTHNKPGAPASADRFVYLKSIAVADQIGRAHV